MRSELLDYFYHVKNLGCLDLMMREYYKYLYLCFKDELKLRIWRDRIFIFG